MGQIKPVTLKDCDWDSVAKYGAVDDVFGIFDGRDCSEKEIHERARKVMREKPEFQASVIIFDPSDIKREKSHKRIKRLFEARAFGSEAAPLPQKGTEQEERMKRKARRRSRRAGVQPRVPSTGIRNGTIIPFNARRKFILQTPVHQGSSKEAGYRSVGFMNANAELGPILPHISRAWRKTFPEYVSHSIWRGKDSSEQGLMHFDSGFLEREEDYPADDRRSFADFPSGLKKSLINDHKALPLIQEGVSGFTLTTAFSGGGTVLVKATMSDYEKFLQHYESRTLDKLKHYFQSHKGIGHQIPNYAVGIMRSGISQDKNVIPCSHFAPIQELGNKEPRSVLYASPRVCHTHPLRSGVTL